MPAQPTIVSALALTKVWEMQTNKCDSPDIWGKYAVEELALTPDSFRKAIDISGAPNRAKAEEYLRVFESLYARKDAPSL